MTCHLKFWNVHQNLMKMPQRKMRSLNDAKMNCCLTNQKMMRTRKRMKMNGFFVYFLSDLIFFFCVPFPWD